MTKYQLVFVRQFDETIASWRSADEPIREADLYRLLHRIKGTASTIDLHDWTDAAEQLLADITEDGLRLWTMAELEHVIGSLMALRKAHDTYSDQIVPDGAAGLFQKAAATEVTATTPVVHSEVMDSLVLLVDDDVAFLQLMKERLEQEGCMVLATPYPDKAIQWFYELSRIA